MNKKGLFIPKEILEMDISATDKLVWSVAQRKNKKMSNAYIVKTTGISLRSVERSLMRLRKRENPSKWRSKWRSNIYNISSLRSDNYISNASHPAGVIENIIGHWNSKGKPFAKATPKSRRTKEAISLLEKLYRVHRGKIYDVIDVGYKHMSNKLFIYRPPKNICLREFIRTTPEDRRHSKALDTLGITSWFRIFAKKTEDEIYAKYYKVPKDKYPEITSEITIVINEFQGHDRHTPYDKKNLIKFSKFANTFCSKNDIFPRTIISATERILSGNNNIKSTGFLVSDRFWNITLPKELVRYGTFKSIREIEEIDV